MGGLEDVGLRRKFLATTVSPGQVQRKMRESISNFARNAPQSYIDPDGNSKNKPTPSESGNKVMLLSILLCKYTSSGGIVVAFISRASIATLLDSNGREYRNATSRSAFTVKALERLRN